MTFGIGSPGFDPIHCPPCDVAAGSVCNVMCVDPIDFGLLVILVLVVLFVFGWLNGGLHRGNYDY